MDKSEIELKEQLEKVDWTKFLEYGIIRVQVRAGKPTLITIERTVKLD